MNKTKFTSKNFTALFIAIFIVMIGVIIIGIKGLNNNSKVYAKTTEAQYYVTDTQLESPSYKWLLTYKTSDDNIRYIYFNGTDKIGSSFKETIYSYFIIEGKEKISICGGSCHINLDDFKAVTDNFIIESLQNNIN